MHPALERLIKEIELATDGPWACEIGRRQQSIKGGHGGEVAIVHGCQDPDNLANGALIADARNALPALIAALVEIERCANGGTYAVTATIVNEIINRHLEPLK